jgi:hypothetical protein
MYGHRTEFKKQVFRLRDAKSMRVHLTVKSFPIRAIALMIEAAITSGTSVNFYQTIRRNNPEYSHLHTRRRENLKSHLERTLLLL